MILLSKARDIGRDHLIHRKRSPFPYEGKDLTRVQSGRDFPCRAQLLTPNSSLYFGEGGPLAVDEVIPPDVIRF